LLLINQPIERARSHVEVQRCLSGRHAVHCRAI
jgi:hypothetical protein